MNKYKQIDYQEVKGEKRWTYELRIIFNKLLITEITITDHPWKKPGREMITKELILEILASKLHKERVDPLPESYLWERDTFLWEITYQGKNYRLIFWFAKHNHNGLWIRNCYRID